MKIDEVMKQKNGTYFKFSNNSTYGKCYLENGSLLDVDDGTNYHIHKEIFDIDFNIYNPDEDFKLKDYGTNIGGLIYYRADAIKKTLSILFDKLDKHLNDGGLSVSPNSIEFIYTTIGSVFGDLE